MNERLRTRLVAVALALLTLAAVIFALLNFQQRSRFIVPDDGITWLDSAHGVVAWHVAPGGPGDLAGVKQGDDVQSIHSIAVNRASDVNRILWRAGAWAELRYVIVRGGETIEVPVVTAPQDTAARCALLRLLPGIVHPVQLPLQRQAEFV